MDVLQQNVIFYLSSTNPGSGSDQKLTIRIRNSWLELSMDVLQQDVIFDPRLLGPLPHRPTVSLPRGVVFFRVNITVCPRSLVPIQ